MGRLRWLLWLLIAGLLVALWVLNASRVGKPEGCPQGRAPDGQQPRPTLRVMSLNILHGFPRFEHLPERLDRIAEEIHRQQADIVLLQEVPWTIRLGSGARYLSERTGMNYVYLRANGNRWTIFFEEGEAILSRYPLWDVDFVELQPRAGFFEHRVTLRATVDTPLGAVRLFVTHLTNGEPEVNQGQAASLLAFVSASSGSPAVVAGDFNATPDSPQIRTLAERWIDTYHTAHPADAGLTCCVDDLTAGPEEPLEERIDYIWLVPGSDSRLEVVEAERVLDQPSFVEGGWLWASDHVGLMVILEDH